MSEVMRVDEVPVEERFTVEDYLAAEPEREERHEYFAGLIRAMAGASDDHEWVAGNFFALRQGGRASELQGAADADRRGALG
ncbi:MAG TPA: hypothetical protein VGO90_15475 [Chthoniobacteraceae bacterium]|jgi:Uma2 family endonuclease|nr:hypothetical protein [Chthoniobacteraceae bacterium]